ncbi:50S ribosomal protein L23 [Candidatus Peregrinibacteria bacterium]|jgi:large subunit ribosomal protein L23|nr:50S ribosomal protein L23 [Candidatus Peregrinibacteria bacterium]MBT3599071.1 50S ribosomal protein L23 [Candidatus Peregrinibacteria bacterium]MBT4367694.1 50S ribosomal protein L23 [Candidatus Peregrinibacteria bacterium]MBT4585620.1 50S ribosomal protein L23 [Candidatus Peregrinibacteria bacterium]MBT6730377.1 50S ribosomal protein L23 [Candidatus Peregrinibacteria bacterium]
MDLSRIILGTVTTEKAERMKIKDKRVVTLNVALKATKIDVKNALKKFYDVDVESVRVMRVPPKVRSIGRGKVMEKRHRAKKVMITLKPKSKALDISVFQ